MKLETILNAMEMAHELYMYCYISDFDKRLRQYNAFRTRILRMDADKDKRIAELKNTHEALVEHHRDDHHTEGTYPTFIPEAQNDSNNS